MQLDTLRLRRNVGHQQAICAGVCLHLRTPRCGEVYNLGGGRQDTISILETMEVLADMGFKLNYTYNDQSRIGDHICYISDLTKIRSHFPRLATEV